MRSSRNVPQEIPEAGFRDNFIRRKDTHAIDFGGGLRISGEMASYDLVFDKAHSNVAMKNGLVNRLLVDRHPSTKASIQPFLPIFPRKTWIHRCKRAVCGWIGCFVCTHVVSWRCLEV